MKAKRLGKISAIEVYKKSYPWPGYWAYLCTEKGYELIKPVFSDTLNGSIKRAIDTYNREVTINEG